MPVLIKMDVIDSQTCMMTPAKDWNDSQNWQKRFLIIIALFTLTFLLLSKKIAIVQVTDQVHSLGTTMFIMPGIKAKSQSNKLTTCSIRKQANNISNRRWEGHQRHLSEIAETMIMLLSLTSYTDKLNLARTENNLWLWITNNLRRSSSSLRQQ
jgi:hypothetical protein